MGNDDWASKFMTAASGEAIGSGILSDRLEHDKWVQYHSILQFQEQLLQKEVEESEALHQKPPDEF